LDTAVAQGGGVGEEFAVRVNAREEKGCHRGTEIGKKREKRDKTEKEIRITRRR